MMRPLGNAFGSTVNGRSGARNNQQPGNLPNLNSCDCEPSCGTYSCSGDLWECCGCRFAMQWVLVSIDCIPHSGGMKFPKRSLRTPSAQFSSLTSRESSYVDTHRALQRADKLDSL